MCHEDKDFLYVVDEFLISILNRTVLNNKILSIVVSRSSGV